MSMSLAATRADGRQRPPPLINATAVQNRLADRHRWHVMARETRTSRRQIRAPQSKRTNVHLNHNEQMNPISLKSSHKVD
jgi:hypothetical protein